MGITSWSLLQQNLHGAFISMAFLLISMLLYAYKRRFFLITDAFFVVICILNGLGWIFGLYETVWWYDEAAHFLTPVVLTYALGKIYHYTFPAQITSYTFLSFIIVTSFGISIGAVWEIAEWLAKLVFPDQVTMSLEDTIMDLVFDSLGALLGAAVSIYMLRDAKGTVKKGYRLQDQERPDLQLVTKLPA